MYFDPGGEKLIREILIEISRNLKRWFLVFCIMVVLETATIIGFLWYISLPAEYDDIQIENDEGAANYIGGNLGGDLYNGYIDTEK